MPKIRVNDVHYYVETTGSGPPLLLLHGFTGSMVTWQPHIPAFAAHAQVISVDFLGHGRSVSPVDADRYQMAQVAADLLAILDELDVPCTGLLGYSMGGRLALYTAVHYPERISHLVLESASPGLAAAPERQARIIQDRALAEWIETHSLAAFVDKWEQLPLWASQSQLPPERRQMLRRQRLKNNPPGLAGSLRGMGSGAQPSLWTQLPLLTLPVLLLVGELDEKFVKINRLMAQLLLYPKLEIVDGAGHMVHLERPERFQQLVLTHVKALTDNQEK